MPSPLESNPGRRRLLKAGFLIPLVVFTGACGSKSAEVTPKPENDAERLMEKTLDAYRFALNHPHVSDKSAAVLAFGILAQSGNSKPVFDTFDQVINPYLDENSPDFSLGAVMSVVPHITGTQFRAEQIIRLYEEAKTRISDKYTAGILTTLALTQDGSFTEIFSAYDEAKSKQGYIYDNDTSCVLASAVLKSSQPDRTYDLYDRFLSKRSFFEYKLISAILTLSSVIHNESLDSVFQRYQEFGKKYPGLWATYNRNAILTLATTINHGNFDEVTQMYEYAKKVVNNDNLAPELTLATLAAKNSVKILSTITTRSTGDSTYNYIVPILLPA